MEEKRICGVKIEKIRKAYFSKKLGDLMSEIMAESLTPADLDELTSYLSGLKAEETSVVDRLIKDFGGKIILDEAKPPTVYEIVKPMTEEERSQFNKWNEEKEKAIAYIKGMIRELTIKVHSNKIAQKDEYSKVALEMLALHHFIDEEIIYRRQLWKQRMIGWVDTYGISRAESEDRSELTDEWKNYKLIRLLKDNVDEFILMSKKIFGADKY